MAEDEIVVRITADDTEILASFDNIREQAEELDSTVSGVGGSMQGAFDPSALSGMTEGIEDTSAAIVPMNTNMAKGSKGMSKFTRMGGRSASMLGRMGGSAGMAGGRIAGMGAMMAGTPFGMFIVLAGAAAMAIGFMGKSAEEEKKRVEEFNKSLREVNDENRKLSQSQRMLKIEGKTVSDLEKQILLRREINRQIKEVPTSFEALDATLDVMKQIRDEQKKNGVDTANLDKNILKMSSVKIEAENEVLKLQNKKLKVQHTINKLIEEEAKKKKENAELTRKLFDDLVRDELQRNIKSLEQGAEKRQEEFKATEEDTKEWRDKFAKFEKQSEKVLQEDITKLKKEYYQKQNEARLTLEDSFITNKRELELVDAEREYQNKLVSIDQLNKLEEETDAEFLTRKAEYTTAAENKLQNDLKIIKHIHNQEDFENDILANDLKNEAELIRLRTKLIREGNTEKEITDQLKEHIEERQRLQLQGQITTLERQLVGDPDLTEDEKAVIRAKVIKAKAEMDNVGAEIADGKTMAELMGISDQTFGRMKQLSDKTKDLVKKAVQERINALQKEADFRNKMVDEKEKNLETEIKLNELGKASNIKLAQEELAAEKELRDKALKDQKEAARVQFAINTAMEASSLASAIAQLYASLSGQGMGAGVAIATGLSAVMIAAFIAAKTQAANASGFAEGGYTGDGGKYQPKGLVHGGEFVIDKETTSRLGLRHKSMSEFEDVMGGHMSDMPNMSAIGKRNRKYSSGLNAQIRQHKEQIYLSYEKGIKEALNGQNSILNGILQATRNTPIVFPMGDDKFLIERGKNKKEIKRIRK